jgi:histone acetyltransferase MYST1
VLARTEGQAYVHYLHQDKRMDGYVPVGCVRLADAAQQGAAELDDELAVDAEEAAVFGDAAAGTLTEEEYDILHHKQIGARRNFDNVYFRTWEIRTWCVCPPARRAAALADAGQVLGAVPDGG